MWSSSFVRLLLVSLCITACGSSTSTPEDAGGEAVDAGSEPIAVPCTVVAPTTCPTPLPRYADVKPILVKNCEVCHDDVPGGPWPLTRYQDVADWYDTVQSDVANCTMPPADSGLEMTDEERVEVLEWLLCGYLP